MRTGAYSGGRLCALINRKAPAERLTLVLLRKTFLRLYFLLRRWWRVLRSNLRCFFFAIRLRRFLITEPIGTSLVS
jgi:hypothetical protein